VWRAGVIGRRRRVESELAANYGPLGRDYIHVHHLLELSRLPAGYQVHPVDDLRLVCPNCHAMIHHGPGSALTIEELKQLRMQG
jgi:5-methylcytosine-specific restriction enzyme A